MEQNIAQQILTEVRRLDAKLEAKIDLARAEWRGYFDDLNASTQHCYGQLSAQVDALRLEIVRNKRKRH